MGLAIAQNTRVTGTVSDESGEPVIGASVVVKGNATVGTVTNIDGQFTLEVPSNAQTLVVKYIGMRDQEVAVAPNVSVRMHPSATELDEVMVVAYGTVKKESFTGSAGVISAAKIEKRTVANVTKAIDGTVAGVTTTSGGGQPGSTAGIRIRGFGSINSSNAPLYVVDGAPYHGDISAINPDDIETVTILKDASAGALYGARGANGVVLVTTKKGSDTADKVNINLKANWGIASRAIPRYELMNEKEYLEQSFILYRNQQIYNYGVHPDQAGAAAINAMLNGNNKLFGTNEEYNPYNMPISQLIDPTTGKVNPNAKLRYSEDWMDEATKDNPLRQEYNLNVSGGTGKTKYYVSLNYLDEEGLLPTTSFERIGGRLNIDTQAQEWLKIGGTASFAFNTTNYLDPDDTANSNVWYAAQNMAPIYPVHQLDENGNIQYDGNGNKLYDYGLNRPSGASKNFNAIALLYDDKYDTKSDNYTLRGFTEINLDNSKYGWAQGLSLKIDVNVANQNERRMFYYNPLYGNAGGETAGRLTKRSTRVLAYTFSQILGYNRTFGDHGIEAMVGHEFFSLKTNYLNAMKTGFPFPGIYELNPGAVLGGISSYENNYTIESLLSRFRYTYATKYNFDVSYRRDATSRFYKDNRWGDFWSVGANWRISEEDFMTDVEWLDNLSLRTSYGMQGNDNILNSLGEPIYYAWQSFYTLGYPNAGNNSSYVSSLENKDLKWEKNANFNVGIEARMFDSRLNVVAEFYNRRTSDLLLSVPMATSLGFDSYVANVGKVNNRGFEFNVGVDIIRTADFDWTFNVIGSTLKNEVIELVTDRPIINGARITKKGEPLYSYYLPKSAGVDPATGKQLYWVWDERDPVTDERISEPYISDDASKAANSREACGSRIPSFFGSIGSDFRIFDFDFSFLTTYSVGGDALVGAYNAYMEPLYAGQNLHKHMERAWQKPGDITDVPRAEFNSGNALTQSHLIDASYFSIRNITLGYTIPRKLTRKLGIDHVRVFATGDNLYTFTHLKGFDPQNSFTGNADYTYTPVRTISGGININF